MRLLITGGSGFVGQHLVRQAIEHFEVHATFFSNEILSHNVQKHKLDFSNLDDIQTLLNSIRPHVIIHTAALSIPDFCENNKTLSEKINVTATELIAHWCKINSARLIFTSTDMVFDGDRSFYKETDIPNPTNFYATTKVTAENCLKNMNLNFVIARVALVYGIGIGFNNNFFGKMINLLNAKEPVTLFYDQFRTPILVMDLCCALLELINNDFQGIIHLGGAERINRWEFGLRACDILNLSKDTIKRGSMFDLPGNTKRPKDISFNINLASSVLQAKLSDCNEGIQKISEYMKSC